MKNIIKSQFYQLWRDAYIYVLFGIVLVMQCSAVYGENILSTLSADEYLAINGGYVATLALMFATVSTGKICGEDFLDKTCNYELLSGHLRKDTYLSRAIVSILVGVSGYIILSVVPMVSAYAIGGWNHSMRFGDVCVRYVLSIFPVLRVICEFIFLNYIVKNAYIGMAIGVFMSFIGQVLGEIFLHGNGIFLGLLGLQQLLSYTEWSTYTLVGEKKIVIYDAGISMNTALTTVGSSIIMGGLFLVWGYYFFAKDDLN